jgi:signal peptidase I
VSGELLGDGYAVRFRALGTSMEPAISDGDLITVAPVLPGDIEPGDVVYYTCGRRTVAHRVVDIRSSPAGLTFIVRGDAKMGDDAPIAAEHVLGKVIAVERSPRPRSWRRALGALVSSLIPPIGRA